MNNKGFTLIETLAVIFIISILSIGFTFYIGNTLSIDKNKAYELFKNNIISSSYAYIEECKSEKIKCNYKWDNNKTSFSVSELINKGYFSELKSPIDNKDLSKCLYINAERENGNINIELVDNCY